VEYKRLEQMGRERRLLTGLAVVAALAGCSEALPGEGGMDQATRWRVANESLLAADIKAAVLHAKSTPPPGRITVEVCTSELERRIPSLSAVSVAHAHTSTQQRAPLTDRSLASRCSFRCGRSWS
jgi:hypothetical protein